MVESPNDAHRRSSKPGSRKAKAMETAKPKKSPVKAAPTKTKAKAAPPAPTRPKAKPTPPVKVKATTKATTGAGTTTKATADVSKGEGANLPTRASNGVRPPRKPATAKPYNPSYGKAAATGRAVATRGVPGTSAAGMAKRLSGGGAGRTSIDKFKEGFLLN